MDETLLTSYALGELTGSERAAVAAYLAGNAEARQFVTEIRATANLLADELARESFGGLTDLQHAAIENTLEDAMRLPFAHARFRRRARWDHVVFALSLAASIAIVCGVISVLLPFVYHHIQTAFHEAPQQAESTDSTNSGPARVEHPTPQIDPHQPGDQPKDIGPVHPDHLASTSGNGNTATADEGWEVPAPDKSLARGPDHDDVPSPLIVGMQTHDQVAHKPAVQVTHATPHDNGSAPIGPVQPKPTGDSSAFLPPDQRAPGKSVGRPDGGAGHAEYPHLIENPLVDTVKEPVSGFSAGVDTASYSNIRRYLTHGQLPPNEAVRIEEMLNYFPVRAAPPASAGETPLVMQVEVGTCPWRPDRRLARICLQARELPSFARPPVNLVFVIDVSDSMRSEKTKLPLLKQALQMIARSRLGSRDRVSFVTYSANSHEAMTVLPPTSCDDKQVILSAIERLETGGKTTGGQGVEVAYELANRDFMVNGVNRIVLATDGNWNIGITEHAHLEATIRDQSRTHGDKISLTVMGVGMNNLKDANLQKLAIAGNGSYAYIDTIDEARKILSDQVNGKLVAAARNVKVQITFNPASAESYRLIGYERRALSRDELQSESKRGGELGAGQSVTALYEVIPTVKTPTSRPVDMLTANVTYADPATLAPHSLSAVGEDHATPVPRTSTEFRFAAAVAEFGLLLRDSDYKGNSTWSSLVDRVQEATGRDDTNYRQEFAKLVRKAKAMAAAAR